MGEVINFASVASTAGQAEREAALASEQRRQGRLLSSRALAVAAASGAGAGDPTVENIIGDIGAEGEFRALSEMFIGEERARGLEMEADLRIFEAGQERIAGLPGWSALQAWLYRNRPPVSPSQLSVVTPTY